MAADPKPEARVKDSDLLKRLHSEWRECVLCGKATGKLSLHHVRKHPRDDLRENLVMLCGDGVAGCHGEIEAGNRQRRCELAAYLIEHRHDTIAWLSERQGGVVAMRRWLEVRYCARWETA